MSDPLAVAESIPETGRRWMLVGRTRSGKSTRAAQIARVYLGLGYTVVIAQQHDGSSFSTFGAPSLITQERVDAGIDWRRALAHEQTIRLVLSGAPEPGPLLDDLAGAMLERGNCLLVLDDQQAYLDATVSRNIANLYSLGRHRNVHIITSTQRTGNTGSTGTSTHARGNVDYALLYQVLEGNELRRLGDYLPNAADILPSLPVPGGMVFRDFASDAAYIYDGTRNGERIM